MLIFAYNMAKMISKNNKNNENIAKRPILAQKALDLHSKIEKSFIFNYMPFVDYARGLKLYYEKGGRKLTDVETNYYFSYPKHIYLDDNQNVICNKVNIGRFGDECYTIRADGAKVIDQAKIECPLFKKGDKIGDAANFITIDNFNNKATAFKEMCGGNIIINECKFSHDFTSLYNGGNDEFEGKKLDLLNIATENVFNNVEKKLTKYEEYNQKYWKDTCSYYTEDIKKLYKDFNEKNLTKDEIDKMLVDFYAKSQLEYMKSKKEEDKNLIYASNLNYYDSCEWGNAVHKLYERNKKTDGFKKEFNKYSNSCESGFFFKDDIEKYEKECGKEGFGDKIIAKYNLKTNY